MCYVMHKQYIRRLIYLKNIWKNDRDGYQNFKGWPIWKVLHLYKIISQLQIDFFIFLWPCLYIPLIHQFAKLIPFSESTSSSQLQVSYGYLKTLPGTWMLNATRWQRRSINAEKKSWRGNAMLYIKQRK